MKSGLAKLIPVIAFTAILAVSGPEIINHVQLWRFRDAVESLDTFCRLVQRHDQKILKNTSVILNGKVWPLIDHKDIYFTIGFKRIKVDFVKKEMEYVILAGEFEHMFSSSEQLRQIIFFRLEPVHNGWQVTAVSDRARELDLQISRTKGFYSN